MSPSHYGNGGMVFSRKQRLEDLLQQSRGGDAGLVFFAGNQAKKTPPVREAFFADQA
ncbi:hypothetical protein RYF71_04390 [Wolbachia endosymbiont of Drosophila malagassya]|nr:hypothetical protein [Wolbachia endosymbiont of Drosophila malagassya]